MPHTLEPMPMLPLVEHDQSAGVLDPTLRLGSPHPIVLVPQVPLEVLRDLGPYRLIRQLGAGGMGIVFEAEDLIAGGRFAVKVLRPTLIAEPEAKKRFFREAQAMASIGHQRIVPVVRVGEDFGIPYLSMPLLLGETLEERLHRAPALTNAEIIRIGIEIAEGLEAAHRRDLVHRDVKPANVWLEEPFASVRLLDLGLAREITKDSLLTHSGMVMGTPAYMSPEQARGDRLDGRSDLFSLGCILYQLSSGVRPFDGPSALHILKQIESHHPVRVSARKASVPTMLSNLIMELLAKRAEDRPPTAMDVMDRLRRIPNSDINRQPALPSSPAIAPTPPPLTKEPLGFRLMPYLLILAALAGICYLSQR